MKTDQLLELADITLSWASNVAEMWVGTLYEKQITIQVKLVKKLLDNKEFDEARTVLFDLAQLVDEAERAYE